MLGWIQTILIGLMKSLYGVSPGATIESLTPVSVSGNVTLAASTIYFVDTSAARTLTMPAPVAGKMFMVKDVTFSAQTNNITFLQSGSEKLENVAGSYVMTANGGAITWASNGTDWFIWL
jgi:hypothetical protein